jgi:hypothetical protein
MNTIQNQVAAVAVGMWAIGLLITAFWLWVTYLIIKLAVKHAIIEADREMRPLGRSPTPSANILPDDFRATR